MSNGEGGERKVDAAVHRQYLHLVLPVKGDRLPAAINGHVPRDGERAGERDIRTTPAVEGDGIAVIIGVGLTDRGVQVGLITGADGDGRLGVGAGSRQPACHGEQADEQAQQEREARPG